MKDEETISIVVKSKNGTFVFHFQTWVSNSPSELQIEDEFYLKFSKTNALPVGDHHEMEILSYQNLEHDPNVKQLQIHKSKKTNGYFISWPNQIEKDTDMIMILWLWSVGTIFTMETGKKYQEEIGSSRMDIQKCIDHFRKHYGIVKKSMIRH